MAAIRRTIKVVCFFKYASMMCFHDQTLHVRSTACCGFLLGESGPVTVEPRFHLLRLPVIPLPLLIMAQGPFVACDVSFSVTLQ